MKICELQKEYYLQGKELTIEEISKILKIPKEEIAMALEISNGVESIDSHKYSDDDSDKNVNIIDTISTNKDEAELVINKVIVQDMIKKLSEKEKQIILLRFYRNKTQTEVAKELGISQVQVSRVEKKILLGMKEQLVS